MTKAILIVLACVGCSASTNKANPCATPGATYLFHYAEDVNGTCGAVPDTIVNIGSDGTLSSSVSCQSITQNGCTAKDTGCSSSSNGVTCDITTDVTFATDGSGATGLESASCSSSSGSCLSTYQVTAVRE